MNIGIISGGDDWTPFHYSINTQEMFCFKEYKSNSETKFIEIEIEITQERQLIASFIYRDSNLLQLNTLQFEIDVSEILEYENGKVKLRFFRFASLVPLGKDNQNDGTFMIKGKFTKLSIVKNNKTESWGIPGNNIESSWLVSSNRIKVDIEDSEEEFSIVHKKGLMIRFLEKILNIIS